MKLLILSFLFLIFQYTFAGIVGDTTLNKQALSSPIAYSSQA